MKGGKKRMNENAKITNKTAIIIVVIVAIIVLIGITMAKNSPLLGPTTQCNDRVDNDRDGRCDYGTTGRPCRDGSIKGDTGCSSSSDNTEASCVAGSTTCGVGACQRTSTCVNDQVSCTPGSPTTEVCDGVDNDCNGLTDENNVCGNPDSCSDSDGGYAIKVQGTVSGYLNNNPYSNTDNCVNSTAVFEYYCSGTSAVGNSNTCGTNATTTCSNGACI